MKLNIKIDTSVEEPEALIITPRMSEEVNKIVDYIGRLNGEPTVISGVKVVAIWIIRYMSWKIRISKIKEKLIKNGQ